MALIFFLLILGVPFAIMLVEFLNPVSIEKIIYYPSGRAAQPRPHPDAG